MNLRSLAWFPFLVSLHLQFLAERQKNLTQLSINMVGVCLGVVMTEYSCLGELKKKKKAL